MIATQIKDIQDATEKVDVFWQKVGLFKSIFSFFILFYDHWSLCDS